MPFRLLSLVYDLITSDTAPVSGDADMSEQAPSGFPDELSEVLRSVLAARGFAGLTPVQQRSLRPVLQGCDLSVCAPTGSGKTLAYGLPLAQAQAAAASAGATLLVLLPTRELAAQTHSVLTWLSHAVGLRAVLCAGGAPLALQEAALRDAAEPPRWVVGTPGRLRDLAARHALRLSGLRAVVLDEADRLLDAGLAEETGAVLAACPPPARLQALWLSATWSVELARHLAAHDEAAARAPAQRRVHVSLAGQGGGRGGVGGAVQHLALLCPPAQQAATAAAAIRLLLAEPGGGCALVFCATREGAEAASQRLQALGVCAASLHGALRQPERDAALAALRAGELRALAATDVAARGLDVPRVELVLHCGAPSGGGEAYAHRAGRAGRPGCRVAGVSLLLYAAEEAAGLGELQRGAQTALQRIGSVEELGAAPPAEGLSAPPRTAEQRQEAARASNALLAGHRLAGLQADLEGLGKARGGGRGARRR